LGRVLAYCPSTRTKTGGRGQDHGYAASLTPPPLTGLPSIHTDIFWADTKKQALKRAAKALLKDPQFEKIRNS
jgi:hypothetical protein